MSGTEKLSVDVLYKDLSAKLQQEGSVDALSAAFNSQETDYDRVNLLLQHATVSSLIDLPTDCQQLSLKCSAVAAKLKAEGNQRFKAKQYLSAVKLYTRSISAALTLGDKEAAQDGQTRGRDSQQALAYANRSAALYHLKDWGSCLKDIGQAFSCGYPTELHYKLFDRRGKCLYQKGQLADAREAFQKAVDTIGLSRGLDVKAKNSLLSDFQSMIAKCEDTSHTQSGGSGAPPGGIQCDRVLPQLPDDGRNPTYCSLSNNCDVIYSPDKGRHLVAKRDIVPGEVVLVEQAYGAVLLPEHYETHCHHCLSHCLALLPCPGCSLARFCGAACRDDAAASYHRHECAILGAVHNSGVGKFGHLALRAVTNTGLARVLALRSRLRSGALEPESPVFEGCDEQQLYRPDDYNAIYRLVTHAPDRAPHDLFRRAVTAVFLLRCLSKAGFFQADRGDSEDEAFVGGLLLSHLQSFPCDAHEVAELQLDRHSVATSEPLELAAGIYSTLSLFNHSCDPGVNRNFYGGRCVVRAIRAIAKGREVADNYGAVYATAPRDARRRKLKPQYYFDCACQACTEDWPLYPDINSDQPVWKCSQCLSPIAASRGRSTGTEPCPQCRHGQDIGALSTTLRASQTKYSEAFDALLGCDVSKALPGLLDHLRVIEGVLCLPWREFNNCQEAVKQCYGIMANCHPL